MVSISIKDTNPIWQGSELIFFFKGAAAQLHLQKPVPEGVVYRTQYILGLPAQI